MKIGDIVAEKTVAGESIAFRTSPPLTEEVFDKFRELGAADAAWTFEEGLLIWRGDMGIDDDRLSHAEVYLTEAENKLENAASSSKNAKHKFLADIATQTGRSIV